MGPEPGLDETKSALIDLVSCVEKLGLRYIGSYENNVLNSLQKSKALLYRLSKAKEEINKGDYA